ncbi:MAG: hypothetical protein GWP08_01830 [Nitrospiraceae bacterium]|nr:hypothetical protein [Nitrospiraceae bacterium]
MLWHLIEGEAGCAYAREHGTVAVVVDALRASATAAMLLDAGATGILAVGEVEQARAAHDADPEGLLYGERGGLPPEGFDYGNSPRVVAPAKGRRVIFTTTTGARRLVDSWGAAAVYMGTTLNARAVVAEVVRHGVDVVLIPAGLATDPAFDAQEDWAAAAFIARAAAADVGEGSERYEHWASRLRAEGVEALFAGAPHAEKLRRVGLEGDIAFCARQNITTAVPRGLAKNAYGVLLAAA